MSESEPDVSSQVWREEVFLIFFAFRVYMHTGKSWDPENWIQRTANSDSLGKTDSVLLYQLTFKTACNGVETYGVIVTPTPPDPTHAFCPHTPLTLGYKINFLLHSTREQPISTYVRAMTNHQSYRP